MTPAARAAAAIELLDDIAAGADPADTIISEYFRRRRYAGSGDRRTVRDHVYAVLRDLGLLKWRIGQAGGDGDDARSWLIAEIVARAPSDLEALFSGGKFGPAPLSDEEATLAEHLADPREAPPRWAQLNCPEWLLEHFDRAFPQTCDVEVQALNAAAPVDLRVNVLRTSREKVQDYLRDEGHLVDPTPLSPVGLRAAGWLPLANTKAFKDGLVEVQDESSQMLALTVGAQPGERVADLCAGAGGKTLALAAMMENSGEILAADISPSRLRRMAPRLQRAGVTIAHTTTIDVAALADAVDPCDRVLIDAPCSGTGAWRRHPEARWHLTTAQLDDDVVIQAKLLRDGARLVRPGGRLIYATCSL
ncbi:MAG: RsmB/NOP family class I SAM-dependent RNA methyltransferase, partial [Alphaproteobacteria bacterium]|nr:RsmB/NOP family class I SAM-dependent RNA methyltransferase [Alphaproteobacteria bacterium]